MTPDVLLKDLSKHGMSVEQIAARIECSPTYIVKLRNKERKFPSYLIMDKIRKLHQEVIHD